MWSGFWGAANKFGFLKGGTVTKSKEIAGL